MIRRLAISLVAPLLVLALAASPVLAKDKYDNRDDNPDRHTELVKKYGLKTKPMAQRAILRAASPEERAAEAQGFTGERTSVGSVSAAPTAVSSGYSVDQTWHDIQTFVPTRRVDFRGTTDIHFSYVNQVNAGDIPRMGYNVYNPAGGVGTAWEQLGGGCEIGSSGDYSAYPTLDVVSTGFVVLAGHDSASGVLDNHLYYQSQVRNCFWGSGTQVPPATYQLSGLGDPTNELMWPQVEIQETGSGDWTHVVGMESSETEDFFSGNGGSAMVYVRKPGSTVSGTWEEPQLIDTILYRQFQLTAARNSDKVAVIYCNPNAEAAANDNEFFDGDVYYRESLDNGTNWGSPVNVTSYDRILPSYAAWIEANGMYDSESNLHIIWNAAPTLENAYTNPLQAWGSDWSGTIFHWRYLHPDPTDSSTSVVHRVEWDGDEHSTCAFGGNSTKLTFDFHISECAGRMYVVWSQVHDLDADPPLVNDCHSGGADGFWGGQGEIYLSVATDIQGNAWDQYRNITHSISSLATGGPGCDSASGNGVCNDDRKSSLSRFGLDRQTGTLPWNDTDPAQFWFWDPANWQSADSIEATWINDSIIHLMYMNDHYPGRAAGGYAQGPFTENDMRWVQLACVDPVTAALISSAPAEVEYPENGAHGAVTAVPITIFNDGNSDLNITEIGFQEDSTSEAHGHSGWLGVSVTSLATISFGDEATFDIICNVDGLIDHDPDNEFLFGHVYLKSNAANKDSMVIPVQFLVADIIEATAWDTLSTAGVKGPGDNVSLIVSNLGEVGRNGLGKVNLDFVIDGGDCDAEADIYLYDGGLVLLEDRGDTVVMNDALHNLNFFQPTSFKPQPPTGPSDEFQSGQATHYDSTFSGFFTNTDTTIRFSQTYYAPTTNTTNPSFIITKTTMSAVSGAEITGLTLGLATDWDLPGDSGSGWNTGGVSVSGKFVYVQGADTLDDPEHPAADCQENTARFGAEVFLGMHTSSELALEDCANNTAFHGAFGGVFHDWWDDAKDTAWAEVLDSLAANSSLTSASEVEDYATYLTFVNNYTLAAGEELTVYTAYASLHNGTVTDLEANVEDVRGWYLTNLRAEGCDGICFFSGDVDGNGNPGQAADLAYLVAFVGAGGPEPSPLWEGDADGDGTINQADVDWFTCALFGGAGCSGTEVFPHLVPCETSLGCCVGTMGSLYLDSEVSGFCDADSTSDQTVDVADLTNMIDHLFINFTPICCPEENDFAPLMYGEEPQDGAIDVVDLTGLIDHLFINFTPLPACP